MNKRISKWFVSAGAAALLAACGGGGSGSGPDVPPPTPAPDLPPPSFVELEDQTLAMAAIYDLQSINDPLTLPVSGSTVYAGGMHLQTQNDSFSMAGQMQLSVDFSTDSLSGNVRNLVDSQETRYQGILTIGAGQIDRTTIPANNEPTFSAPLTGDVSSDVVAINVDGTMQGYFMGPDHEAAYGFVTGTISAPNDTAPLAGGFIGTR